MAITKKDIVLKITEETNLKQVDVKKIVQSTLDHIIDALAEGKTVELRNFGVFKVRSRKRRIGRNPKTGESVEIPQKKVVSFKRGLAMKEKIR